MSKRVTMQDIADAVGVNKGTVSRAFRGNPKCGPELREKILRKAADMGYKVDAMQSLHMARVRGRDDSKKPSGLVIALLECCTPEIWANKRRLVLEAAAKQAAIYGLKTEVFDIFSEPYSMGRTRSILQARGIRGLIVGPMPEGDARLDFDFSDFAAVTISPTLVYPRLHCIDEDQYGDLWLGLQRMYDRGFRRVGLAIGDRDEARYLMRRRAAYMAFCQKNTEMAPVPLFIQPEQVADIDKPLELYPEFLEWVEREELEVVIGLKCWIPDALKTGGYRIPEDIQFFNCCAADIREDASSFGVLSPWAKVGRMAIDAIYGQWSRFECGVPDEPMKIELKGEVYGL